MEKLKVAVVGCGKRSRTHLRALKSFEDVDVVAVCDPVDEVREQRREEFEITNGYAHLADLLTGEQLDAIFVVTPPHLNAKVSLPCLEAGVSTLMEKPPGLDIEETMALRAAAERTGAKGMVGWNRRFHPMLLQAKRMVLERGPITQLVGEFHKSMKGIQAEGIYHESIMDKLFLESPIHAIDAVCALADSKAAEVHGIARRSTTPYRDVHTGIILFENGCVGTIISNYTTGARLERYEIHGDEISCYLEGIRTGVAYVKGEKIELEGAGDASGIDQARYFLDCVRDDRPIEPPGCNLDCAVETMKVALKILESISD
jgi:predicted dehydrogenase